MFWLQFYSSISADDRVDGFWLWRCRSCKVGSQSLAPRLSGPIFLSASIHFSPADYRAICVSDSASCFSFFSSSFCVLACLFVRLKLWRSCFDFFFSAFVCVHLCLSVCLSIALYDSVTCLLLLHRLFTYPLRVCLSVLLLRFHLHPFCLCMSLLVCQSVSRSVWLSLFTFVLLLFLCLPVLVLLAPGLVWSSFWCVFVYLYVWLSFLSVHLSQSYPHLFWTLLPFCLYFISLLIHLCLYLSANASSTPGIWYQRPYLPVSLPSRVPGSASPSSDR